jgi:hypothetical protein
VWKPAWIPSSCTVYPSCNLLQRFQLLVLGFGPTTQTLVEVKQYVSDDTFAKQSIIGQPALQPTLAISAYIRQFLLTPILPWPTVDFLPNPLGRFLADSGNKIQPLLALFCLNPAWPERVTEKIKGYSIVAGFVPATFAVCDLCLDRMERQPALVESVIEKRL